MKTKNVLRLLFIAAGAAALYWFAQEKSFSDLRDRLGEEFGDQEGDDRETFTGTPNPVKKLSAAEFSVLTGTGVDTEDLADSHPYFYSIGSAPVLYGVQLEDSDCLKYDFRLCSRSCDVDISGMYYQWTETALYPQDAPVCEVLLNETGQGVCRWEDGERKYTISMTEGASLVKLVWMRQKLCSIMG